MLQETAKNNVLALQSFSMDWEELFHNCISIASSSSTANPNPCDS
jgi:hypothetical protein